MRSPNSIAVIGLLLSAAAIALANLWFTSARSTIPLALDDIVVERKTLTEKHPGIDDVHVVVLKRGVVMQVDQPVFDALEPGAHITKRAWSTQLRSDDRIVDLTWSFDVWGMAVVMPAALLTVVASLVAIGLALQK